VSEPATDQRIVESENGSNMSSINISDIIAVSHVENLREYTSLRRQVCVANQSLQDIAYLLLFK